MKNVSVVIVTFNRKNLLQECIQSILNQSHPVNKIIVVNNASTDGTTSYLNELQAHNPQIIHIHSPQNTGGAGGFHLGLKSSMELTSSDWFWIMDDDVEALPDALEGLLVYSELSDCLHGKRLNSDGSPYLWEASFKPSIGFSIPKADTAFKMGKLYTKVNVGCFEGMLASRELIKKIGLPDTRFFIAWDDTIYGYLASKHTNVLYVNHTTLIRKRSFKSVQLGIRTLNESSDMYRYYHIRNRALVKEYLQSLGEYRPIAFNIFTGVLFLKEYFRAIVLQKKFDAFKPLWRGLKDGYLINKM